MKIWHLYRVLLATRLRFATFEYFPCPPMHCTSFELLFAFVCVFLQGHHRALLAWEQSRWSFLQFVSVSLPALLRQTASYQPPKYTAHLPEVTVMQCNGEIYSFVKDTGSKKRNEAPFWKSLLSPPWKLKMPDRGKRGSSITNPIPLPISVMEGMSHRSWNKQYFIFIAKSSYATRFHANMHLRLISLIAELPSQHL